jgi:hypothetical protein
MNQQKQKVNSTESKASATKKKASATKKKDKPRKKNPPEHNQVIDAFDAIITFSYAYEWQKLQNNEVDKLFELRDLISSHIENEAPYIFIMPKERESAVIQILNKLKQAAKDDSCPKAVDFDDVWLNKPRNLTGIYLAQKHSEKFDCIVMLAMSVVKSLNRLLPDELKPSVPKEQVGAMLEKLCKEMPYDFKVPIHKELLTSRLHQYFLGTFASEQGTFKEVNAYRKLVDSYCKEAERRLVKMVEENVIGNSVIHFFTQAKGINIEIDRYYPWALICYGVMDYQDLLAWYSSVNALGLVEDSQYEGGKTLDDVSRKSELVQILQKGLSYRQYPSSPKDGIQRYMFDSNRAPIIIDGKPLQNHLVMALPYDKPISDLQDNLRNYARYLGNEATSYSHTYSHIFEFEDTVNSAMEYRKLDIPYRKLALSNAGSVLQDICSLLCLQFERSSIDKPKKYQLKKRQRKDVHELIEGHGFKYKEETVETVRKNKEKNMLETVNRFLKL